MMLVEFWNQNDPNKEQDPYTHKDEGYQDQRDDKSTVKLTDTRKTRLTLKQINKIRRMNDVKAVEYKEKLKRVKKQYSQPVEAPAL